MGSGNTHGLMAIVTWEITKKGEERAMGSCIIKMVTLFLVIGETG